MIGRIGLMALAAGALLAAEPPLNQRQARTSPEWLTGGVMYQIQPRAFTPEGTLKAAQARLPKLAELGVTVLYLCPVFVADDDMDQTSWSPRQKKSGMNNPRNPYRMKDFYHVDPEYGTDQDLKDFVAAAHALKLRVMLDMVYLHCGPTAVFLEAHPDFIKRAKDGKAVNAAWAFPALNYGSPELREYMWKNMEWWIRDFDVDGFRCDVADGVPLDFWEAGRERIEKIRPDVGMLAEGTKAENQLKAFDLCYGWGKPFAEMRDAAAFRKHWETLRKNRPVGGAKFVRFIDNHDIANDDYENRIEKRWGAAKVRAALAANFALDGVPFLYNGQEVADTARHSIFGRLPINWANGETAAGKARFVFVQKLCALRKAEPALTKGAVEWLDSDQPGTVLSFARTLGGERVVAVVNLTDKPVKVAVKGADAGRALLAQGASGDAAGGLELAGYGFWIVKK
ncbi:MAG TPA: alpha-amylase family glycosyl hydrolase [Kiritimatiellia bacterium]|nr:alpha-amylase family glycosyl hydrolase [Kiritimatiellia bacterium]